MLTPEERAAKQSSTPLTSEERMVTMDTINDIAAEVINSLRRTVERENMADFDKCATQIINMVQEMRDNIKSWDTVQYITTNDLPQSE